MEVYHSGIHTKCEALHVDESGQSFICHNDGHTTEFRKREIDRVEDGRIRVRTRRREYECGSSLMEQSGWLVCGPHNVPVDDVTDITQDKTPDRRQTGLGEF